MRLIDADESISICNYVGQCNACPFESECDYNFDNIVSRQKLIGMLGEKLIRIMLMLSKIEDEVSK